MYLQTNHRNRLDHWSLLRFVQITSLFSGTSQKTTVALTLLDMSLRRWTWTLEDGFQLERLVSPINFTFNFSYNFEFYEKFKLE